MDNYVGLSSLLAHIEADIRIRSTPQPTYSFEEWLAIRRELREIISEVESLSKQKTHLLAGLTRSTPSFADTSD